MLKENDGVQLKYKEWFLNDLTIKFRNLARSRVKELQADLDHDDEIPPEYSGIVERLRSDVICKYDVLLDELLFRYGKEKVCLRSFNGRVGKDEVGY